VTDVGLSDSPDAVGGFTVSVVCSEAELNVAVIVEGVAEATGVVVTANVAEDEPAGIETVVGTAAEELLEVRPIVNPPVGAGPSSVTVPVELVPPVTLVGDTVRVERPWPVIASVAFAV
jgi:hypothetical protein